MSRGICPVFKPSIRGVELKSLGETLAREFEALDEIARANRLAPFTEFADNREIPEGFDGDPVEAMEMMEPFDKWFDPAEAKADFQALLDLIKQKPEVTQKLKDPESVVCELDELVRALAIAEERKAKFHLDMS